MQGKMKKIILLTAVLVLSLSSYAWDFKMGGIYYNITSASQRTVEVTYYDMGIKIYVGNVEIPSSVTSGGITYSVTSIGGYAFYYCSSLTSITIPNSVTSIGGYAFYYCSSLTSITIPNSVTSIGYYAFEGTDLKSITIPAACSSIGTRAFMCSKLREVFCLCPKPESKSGPFPTSSCEIYVPSKRNYAAWTENYKQMIEFVSADANTFTYTGTKPSVSFTNNLPALNASITASLETNVGSYETFVEVKYTGEKEFEVEIPYSYTINKAPARLVVNDAVKVYGDENPKFSYATSGLIGEDEFDKVSLSTTANTQSDAGNYAISASVEAKNYEVAVTEGTLTIQKAPLVVKVNDQKRKYGETNPAFTLSYTGLKCDDAFPTMSTDFTISTKATKGSSAGEYEISVSGGVSNNYSFSQYKNGTLTIEPVPLTINPVNATRVYGDKNPEFTFTYTGFVNGDNASSLSIAPIATCAAKPTSEVGDYAIAVDGAVSPNYIISYGSALLTVEKAPLKIKAENVTREYGAANPEFTFIYTGFKNDETEDVLLKKPTVQTVGVASDVGQYDIVSSGADARNYKITYDVGTMTITKAPLTATAKSVSRTYGSENPEFGIAYSGFRVNDDESCIGTPPTAKTVADSSYPVGSYAIHLSDGEAKNYYFQKYNDGTLSIDPASLRITPVDATRVYGDRNPEFTFTYTGFVNNDNATSLSVAPIAICSAKPTSEVGEYTINADGAVSTNYTISYGTALLTVEKAPLTIQASNVTREYGTANPEFSFIYTGFKNEETEDVLLKKPTAQTVNIASAVGQYEIVSSGASAQNYKITYEAGTMTITKAPLTATAKNASREYGSRNPEFGITYSGFRVNDDESSVGTPPTAKTAADSSYPVGSYAIHLSGGDAKNYYFQKYNDGMLTITKALLVLTVENTSRLYFENNPSFSVKGSGFKNNDNVYNALSQEPIYTCEATKKSPAGEYAISAQGAEATNYTLTYRDGTLEVRKRSLTLTTGTYSRPYGEDNPDFNIDYKGFVNNEDVTAFTILPKAKTTAIKTSPVGTYPITIEGGEAVNYDYTYTQGTLMVEKTYQDLTWEQEFEDVVVLQEIELQAKANSGLKIDYTVSDSQIASIEEVGNRAFLICNKVGEVTVKASQKGNDNYYKTNAISKTITIHNLPDNTVPIEIKQGEHGAVSTMTEIGFARTFIFSVTEGWKIHSVTFNGRDVTNQLIDNAYTTPVITDASSLVVAYEDDGSSVNPRRASEVRVTGSNGVLHVTGAEIGEIISVYDEDGRIVAKEVSASSQTDILLNENKLYIVNIDGLNVKILL